MSQRSLVLACITTATFTDLVAYSVAVPVLPDFARRLHASPTMVGLLFGSFGIGAVAGAFTVGRLRMTMAAESIIRSGILIWTVGCCVVALSRYTPLTMAALAVLGAGFVVEVEADGAGLDRRLGAIGGVTRVETIAPDRFRLTAERDVRPDAARAVVAANGALRRLSVDEPSLDAIYTRFFQGRPVQQGVRHAA